MDNISLTKSISISVLVLIASVFLVSCDGDDPPSVSPNESSNTADLIASSDQLSTLSGLLNDAGLTGQLNEKTVFAPTNAAFENLPDGTLDALSDSEIETILTYHVLDGITSAGDVSNFQTAETLQGSEILLTTENGVTVNDGAVVIGADLGSSNGIVHAIDQVLLPPSFRTGTNIVDEASNNPNFSAFLDAVDGAGLNTLLSTLNSTVFIPTNQALQNLNIDFTNLPDTAKTEILTYHILPDTVSSSGIIDNFTVSTVNGEAIFTTIDDNSNEIKLNDNATVVTADDSTGNGFIHSVDDVLLPNKFVNVTRIIDKNFNLDSLYQSVVTQGLAGGLTGEGPFTVLAPTNNAFEDADLSGFSDSDIQSILNFHVIASELLSSDIIVDAIENSEDGEITKTTFNDEDLTFTLDDETVLINGQDVISTADLEGSNGVVHIIDGILVPPSLQ